MKRNNYVKGNGFHNRRKFPQSIKLKILISPCNYSQPIYQFVGFSFRFCWEFVFSTEVWEKRWQKGRLSVLLFCNFTRGVDDLNGMQSVERSTVNDKRPSRCLVSSFAGDGEEKLSLSFLSFHLKNIFSSKINYRSLYL